MQTNSIYAADLALMQAALDALRFHAERLHAASLAAGADDDGCEPRITAPCQLAEHVLNAIAELPALYSVPLLVATPAIEEVF